MNNKGAIEPTSLTTAQRDALSLSTSDTGIIFNTTSSQYEVWNGTAWASVLPQVVTSSQTGGSLTITLGSTDPLLIPGCSITLPSSGTWRIDYGVHVRTASSSDNRTTCYFGIQRNGTSVEEQRHSGFDFGPGTTDLYIYTSRHYIASLASGDVIRSYVRRLSGDDIDHVRKGIITATRLL